MKCSLLAQLSPMVHKRFHVVALYDFDGKEKGDLSLKKGQKVTVLNDSNKWWGVMDNRG